MGGLRCQRGMPLTSAIALVALFAHARVAFAAPLTVVKVETASDSVIAVTLQNMHTDPAPSQTTAAWAVNGQPPVQVGRLSRVWQQDLNSPFDMVTMRHTIYLVLGAKLVEGTTYDITGTVDAVAASLLFREKETMCESLHANQIGYFEYGTKTRYANFGVFLGSLGAQQLTTPPTYSVYDAAGARVLGPLTSTYLGLDNVPHLASGDHVYRMDLTALGAGGPYTLVAHGCGRTYPFGVGANYTDLIWYTMTRGLFHKRCGMALDEAHTHWSRCACHTQVLVTDAEPGFVDEDACLGGCSHSPVRSIKGGYHDAGDFDRGPGHTIFPIKMLETYELFHDVAGAFVLDIPETANDMPDLLDEALWGVLLWENLQESDGGVRGGTEAPSHPIDNDNAGNDRLVYSTFRRMWHTTASGAGMFAHASRLVRPYNESRADELLERSLRAWGWMMRNLDSFERTQAPHMYAALQLYMTTRNVSYHTALLGVVKEFADLIPQWPQTYWTQELNVMQGAIYSPYFFSYLYNMGDLPTEQWAKDVMLEWIEREAKKVMDSATFPYITGPIVNVAWGSTNSAGVYANPILLKYLLTNDTQYLEMMFAMASYMHGVNPLGRSWVTEFGAAPPNDNLDLDSYSQIRAGKSRVPGILIFGPIAVPEDYDYEKAVWSLQYPKWDELPEQRRFADAHTLVTGNEFNTVSTLYASMYFITLATLERRMLAAQAALSGSTPAPVAAPHWQDHVPPLTHNITAVLGINVCVPPPTAARTGSTLFDGSPGAAWDAACMQYGSIIAASDAVELGEPARELLRFEPDRYHAPSLTIYCGRHDRMDFSGHGIMSVRIRLVDPNGPPVTKFDVGMSSYRGQTHRVNIAAYVEGDDGQPLPDDKKGAIGAEWVWARVPMSVVKSEFDGCAVEHLVFDVLPSAQQFYVSDIIFSGDSTPPCTLVETTSSADNTIVLAYDGYGMGTPPSQDPADYRIDGVQPDAVGRFTMARGQSHSDCDRVYVRHRIYLVLPNGARFVNKRKYVVQALTRHGPPSYDFVFDETKVRCESIKTNQVGYAHVTNGTQRYAMLGIWNGHLGSRKFDALPSYYVLRLSDNAVVFEGVSEDPHDNTHIRYGSGEFTYRLPLGSVPEGGPYKVVVRGAGCSYPFGIGGTFSRHLTYVETRGLYHQRCGTALEPRYTEHYRGSCHTVANVTDGEYGGFVHDESPVQMTIKGSWHDAGDFDRSFVHQFVPATMLVMYGAYSHLFRDAVNDIPESGNGIPDFLDEALYGVLLWEMLQDADGGVRAGTETSQHPGYPTTADTDRLQYRTYRKMYISTMIAAGLFAHSSRLVRPYDPSRADTLLWRAKRAFQWAEATDQVEAKFKFPAPRNYACLHIYIATGDEWFHECFKTEMRRIQLDHIGGYFPEYWTPITMQQGQAFSDYFYDYALLNTTGVTKYNTSAAPGARDVRPFPVDETIAQWIREWISNKAKQFLRDSKPHVYPMGAPMAVGFGSLTSQGTFAEVYLLEYRLSGDAQYLPHAENLADYTIGLNPLSKSYVTGLGFDTPASVLHLDSFHWENLGKGPVPGLTLYGPFAAPSQLDYQHRVYSKAYPNWYILPDQRRFAEGWSFVDSNEFTIVTPMAADISLFATLEGLTSYRRHMARRDALGPQRSFVYDPHNDIAYACNVDAHCFTVRPRYERSWKVLSVGPVASIDGVRVRDGAVFARNSAGAPCKSVDVGETCTTISEDELLAAREDGYKPARIVDGSDQDNVALGYTLNGLPEGSIDGPFHVTSRGIYVFDDARGMPRLVGAWTCASDTCSRT